MDMSFKGSGNDKLPLIVVTEGNADEMCLISDVLGEKNFRVLGYSDCDKAYDLITRETPVLSLVDVHLPGNCGIDLIRKIRLAEHLRSMPVIAIISAESEKDLAGGGADAFLRRPFDAESLKKTVDSLLMQKA